MAPKKAKKAADSINSRLALVMKSGKGMLHLELCASFPRKSHLELISPTSHSRLQIHTQISTIWQSQTRHHRWQHPAPPQERARVLLHAVQDQCAPFRWKQCEPPSWSSSPAKKLLEWLWRVSNADSLVCGIDRVGNGLRKALQVFNNGGTGCWGFGHPEWSELMERYHGGPSEYDQIQLGAFVAPTMRQNRYGSGQFFVSLSYQSMFPPPQPQSSQKDDLSYRPLNKHTLHRLRGEECS